MGVCIKVARGEVGDTHQTADVDAGVEVCLDLRLDVRRMSDRSCPLGVLGNTQVGHALWWWREMGKSGIDYKETYSTKT